MKEATILIVEDDSVVCTAIEAGLQNLGYSISAIVSSGKSAIQKTYENKPDLVLMDIELEGDMDGITAAEIIRSRFDIPIIFLTAFADEERIERAKLTMPYGYILKPFRLKDLKASIEMALYISKIEKEHKQMQENLRQKSERLERILDATTDGIWTYNIQTNELSVSPRSYILLGYEPYEFEADLKSWKKIIHPDDINLLSDMAVNLKVSSEAYKHAFRLKNKSGNYCWVRTRAKVIERDENGNPVLIIGNHDDITQRKQAEDQVKNQNLFLQMLIDVLPVSIYYKNTERIYIGCNDSYAGFLGLTKDMIIGKSVHDIFPKDLADKYSEMDQKLLKEPGIQQYEFEMTHADGKRHDILTRKTTYCDESGSVIGIIGVIIDLFIQKKTELEIREREELLRQLFDNMNECVAIYKPVNNGENFVFVDFNNTGLIFGKKTKEQVIGKKVTEVFPGITEFGLMDILRNVNKTGAPQYHPLSLYKDNSIKIWVENYIFKLPSGLIVAIYQDTSEKKKMEEELKKSEERYRTIIENTNEAIILQEASGKIITWNKAAERIFGINIEEVMNYSPLVHDWNAVHEDGSFFPKSEYSTKITFSTGKPCKDVVMGIKGKSEDIFWISVNTNPLFKENESKPYAVVITVSDINERKKSESDLRKLSEAVRQASQAVAIVGTDIIIEYANPSFEKMTGYTHDEIIGSSPLIHGSNRNDFELFNNIRTTIIKGERWTGQILNRRKDNTFYTAECYISPVKNKNGQVMNFIWMMRDITRELDIEKRLAQAQKMEAIGTLAGGIAHDFNNILFPMVGYAQMALYETPEYHPVYKKLKEILSGAERAADLVKQILTFSRKSSEKPIPIKIDPIIKEVLKLIRSTLPKTIEIQQDISDGCGIVMADPIQIHQIVMNLITNAFHAMEETGGILKVTLENTQLKHEDLKDPAMPPGKYACLSVEDTGIGMNSNVIERMFDPYFTTKEDGKGTGLGLSVVHSIVKSYLGEIKVYSEPGKGSVFRVYLPLSETNAEENKLEATSVSFTGSGHIMIVDDDEAVVRTEKQMLELLGYQVTATTDGAETLKSFREKPDSFDLVISDMTMPHMTGFQLAKKLSEIRPDIPIVISTGYNSQFNDKLLKEAGIHSLITKPIAIEELSLLIKNILKH